MKKVRFVMLAVAGLSALSVARASLVHEKFATDPAFAGWQIFGDTNLFQWDSTNQALAATWDSSQSNSYCYHPLGGTFTRTNDFLVAFDLRLADITIGANPAKPLTFEIAIGLLNTNDATSPAFIRGAGMAPNLVEFTYFPNDIYNDGAVSTLFISTSNNYSGGGFANLLELPTHLTCHVQMTYRALSRTLHTTVTTNGTSLGTIPDSYLSASFDDFAVNAISINSYNDDGQYPGFEGSVLAHGFVDNLTFASPLPVDAVQITGAGQVRFASDTNWLYTLEQTTDFQIWTAAAPATFGNGTVLVLQATNLPADTSFYRVRADLP
jgi:hypothetical protein